MTEEKSSGINITAKEFGRRFRKALSVPFLLNQVCSANTSEFISAYSSALGCSEKSFLFPLLTCTAACMGNDCSVELAPLWREPTIIWTLVITPRSLLRVDIAQHLKQELLKIQDEKWSSIDHEDSKNHFKKFVFDLFTLDQLQEMLKLSNGHGIGIYNSIQSLYRCMLLPEEVDIMQRLHYGLGWFTNSRCTRNTLSKTRMNISVISTPSVVQQTLTAASNFNELFYQCFLTVCAEESLVKFSQFSTAPETDKLREIFQSLIDLHSNDPIVYKLNAEGAEKFGQIHDELVDKAKQMTRKNVEHKIFQPALSYLGRLCCILHVLDNIIDSINYKVPISRLTWNTEINATTVWHARELLGHIIEQRHALMEQTTFVAGQKVQRSPAINLDGPTNVQRTPPIVNSPLGVRGISPRISPRGMFQRTPNIVNYSPRVPQPRLVGVNYVRASTGIHSVRRNLMNNIVNPQANSKFDSLLNKSTNNNAITPCITSVTSAGLPVANEEAVVTPRGVVNNMNAGYNASQMSASRSNGVETSQPVLLSRTPYVSVLDISDDDFIKTHSTSIRKVLLHNVSRISPSCCVQLKLIFDPTAVDNAQKYSVSFARTFLKKLEKLGFGVCQGLKNGNLRHFVFEKKKFSALQDMQIKRLSELNINEKEYNKCFNLSSRQKSQNGNVVCLD